MLNANEKESIILGHQKLVYSILKKFNNLHNEDLFQTGMIGLIKAAENYDESKGTTFMSYAYMCISNEILIYFRKQNRKSFNDYANTISYNTIIDEENTNNTFESLLGYTPDFDNNIIINELYANINKILTPVEKEVIIYYYGLYNITPIKQKDLSKKFNMSQAYISRVIRRARRKLKAAMEE